MGLMPASAMMLAEFNVGRFFLLIRHAVVERLEYGDHFPRPFGVRRGDFGIGLEIIKCRPIPRIFGPRFRQLRHGCRVVTHYRRHLLPKLLLGWRDLQAVVQVKDQCVDAADGLAFALRAAV
jgi:hypothetical protein